MPARIHLRGRKCDRNIDSCSLARFNAHENELPCGSRTMGNREIDRNRKPRSINKMQKGFNPVEQHWQWGQTCIEAPEG